MITVSYPLAQRLKELGFPQGNMSFGWYKNISERILPDGYAGEFSKPFIEHRKNGKVVQSVNCEDIAVIIFWEDK